MKQVNVHEAKTQLSKLIEEVLAGEDIVIARSGKPAVALVPVMLEKKEITFGLLRGKFEIGDDFDAPLPADILAGLNQ